MNCGSVARLKAAAHQSLRFPWLQLHEVDRSFSIVINNGDVDQGEHELGADDLEAAASFYNASRSCDDSLRECHCFGQFTTGSSLTRDRDCMPQDCLTYKFSRKGDLYSACPHCDTPSSTNEWRPLLSHDFRRLINYA